MISTELGSGSRHLRLALNVGRSEAWSVHIDAWLAKADSCASLRADWLDPATKVTLMLRILPKARQQP